jgi:hypothetical protein
MSDDLSHDPHLRAALRHAPDHALAPPAGVSQTILNAARQVHQPARPAATPGPAVRVTVAPPRAIAWLRQWFASPRLAGGLATGLVAALGLGLWLDLEREPVLDRAPVHAAKEPTRFDTAPEAERAVPAPSPEPAAVAERRPDAPAAPPPAAEAARAKRAQRVAEAKAERAPAAAAPAPATPAPAAPAPAAPVPRSEPAPSVAEERGAAQKSAAQPSADAALRDALAPNTARLSAAAADGAASPASALLRRARAELANGSARWTWMPPGKAAIVPLDGAAQDWISRAAQAAGTRWTDTTERAGPGDALEVRWWRDDWPQATLRIESEGLRWIEHSGPIRYAPLDAATLQRLRGP